MFKMGLHYVGDWHTHPEANPSPSGTDLSSMRERVILSGHQLPGFVMCIVGKSELPGSLWLSLHTQAGHSKIGLAKEL